MQSKIIEFLKKHKIGLLLSILLSCAFVLPLLSETLYYGHDTTFHLNRIVGIGDAFRDGQFIPKIYPYTNNGYGYIVPLWYCDLFLYPFAILHLLGMPLVITYKVMLAFYIGLGTVLMYFVLSKIFKNIYTINIGLVLYSLNSYRFINSYIRGAFGEILSFTFLPLVILALYYIFVKRKDSYILLGISMSLIAMTHNLTLGLIAFFIAVITTLFIIVNYKNKVVVINIIKTLFKGTILAILLSFWYLGPLFEQITHQTLVVSLANDVFHLSANLIQISDLFNPFLFIEQNVYFGLDSINAYGLGLILAFTPAINLLLKNTNKIIKTLTIIMYVFILLSLGIIPFYLLDISSILQFTFRWYILIVPISIICTAYALSRVNKKIMLLIITLFILNNIYSTYQIMNLENSIKNIDTAEFIFIESLTYDKDHNSIQMSDAMFLPPTEKNDYLEDTTFIKLVNNGLYEDIIYDYNRHFTHIYFDYESSGDELLMLPLTYYKGYEAYAIVDGEKVNLEIVNVDVYHKVGINTVAGNATYHIQYKGTLIQTISLIVCLITLISIILVTIKKYKNKK